MGFWEDFDWMQFCLNYIRRKSCGHGQFDCLSCMNAKYLLVWSLAVTHRNLTVKTLDGLNILLSKPMGILVPSWSSSFMYVLYFLADMEFSPFYASLHAIHLVLTAVWRTSLADPLLSTVHYLFQCYSLYSNVLCVVDYHKS
jgi:hypothetical protein